MAPTPPARQHRQGWNSVLYLIPIRRSAKVTYARNALNRRKSGILPSQHPQCGREAMPIVPILSIKTNDSMIAPTIRQGVGCFGQRPTGYEAIGQPALWCRRHACRPVLGQACSRYRRLDALAPKQCKSQHYLLDDRFRTGETISVPIGGEQITDPVTSFWRS